MTKAKSAICFGEILIDKFPDESRIGGAPLNVAARMSSFGIDTGMISKIGNDEEGELLLQFLEERKVDTSLIIRDPELPTGIVEVKLDKSGSASYTINYPAAWDKIEISEAMLEKVKHADCLICGSLVCRDDTSRDSLFQLLKYAKFKVIDLNLRPPYYSEKLLISLMEQADLIKFNDDELYEIGELLGCKSSGLEQIISFIAHRFDVQKICVTKGSHGAVLYDNGDLYYNSGFKIKVKDTVGAGDSFLATLISGILNENDLQEVIQKACAVGALVASKEGANPVLKEETIKNFIFPA